MSTELKLANISQEYKVGPKHITALQDISLSIQRREIVCLIGPNGCGKSSLLKIIAGIEQPSSGTMELRKGASYLPQQPSLLPWRTVAANLALPGDILHSDQNANNKAIRKWLRDFELIDFIDMYPQTLSGGMQQKVALLRTVLCNTSLLLLDEPFASLDAITRLEMQRWLKKLIATTHSSVLCVTHDIQEAIFLSDTIYVLSKRPGQIIKRLDVTKSRSSSSLEKTLRELLIAPS